MDINVVQLLFAPYCVLAFGGSRHLGQTRFQLTHSGHVCPLGLCSDSLDTILQYPNTQPLGNLGQNCKTSP